MPKLYTVEAEVHQSAKVVNGYRVKVSVIDLGLYINGMVVYPPDGEHKEWSVLTPARPTGKGGWARIVEFNKKLPLWEHIYEACVDAAKLEESYGKDVVITDIPDEPINLDDIPF